jgi:hypothetical protein
MQAAGKDPVGWVINYTPIITTLGNPNFTSGFLGLSGIAIFLLFVEAKDQKVRVFWVIVLIADLYILERSGSIQGLFGFLFGVTIIILVKLWLVNKKYGQMGILAAIISVTPIALAVFNIGPLAAKLYQGTLRNRLDYWHAAIDMFRDYPIFGVGIDRFGEYYRQYAVQNQVVQGQATDNAHSVYLQILATGGLITFVPYILIIGFVTYCSFKGMFQASGETKLRLAGLLGVWIGTITVNIVAIDNLGVSVWFWITGGVIIAVSISVNGYEKDELIDTNQNHVKNSKSERDSSKSRSASSKNKSRVSADSQFPISTLIATGLVVVTLVMLLPILGKSESFNSLKANAAKLDSSAYAAEINREVEDNYNNPQSLILLSDLALRQGEIDLSFKIGDRIRQLDPRSFYGHYLPAIAYEATSKPAEAIAFREKLVELDPWNTVNMVQLVKNYLAVGKKDQAAAIAALIKQNYPGSQSDLDAAALLVG